MTMTLMERFFRRLRGKRAGAESKETLREKYQGILCFERAYLRWQMKLAQKLAIF